MRGSLRGLEVDLRTLVPVLRHLWRRKAGALSKFCSNIVSGSSSRRTLVPVFGHLWRRKAGGLLQACSSSTVGGRCRSSSRRWFLISRSGTINGKRSNMSLHRVARLAARRARGLCWTRASESLSLIIYHSYFIIYNLSLITYHTGAGTSSAP